MHTNPLGSWLCSLIQNLIKQLTHALSWSFPFFTMIKYIHVRLHVMQLTKYVVAPVATEHIYIMHEDVGIIID